MVNLNTTEAHNDVEELWSKAVKKPVTVLSARNRGVKAGFAKHLFGGVDLNALLATNLDDVFEGYHHESAQGAR